MAISNAAAVFHAAAAAYPTTVCHQTHINAMTLATDRVSIESNTVEILTTGKPTGHHSANMYTYYIT